MFTWFAITSNELIELYLEVSCLDVNLKKCYKTAFEVCECQVFHKRRGESCVFVALANNQNVIVDIKYKHFLRNYKDFYADKHKSFLLPNSYNLTQVIELQ
jgi:hypothetical protein